MSELNLDRLRADLENAEAKREQLVCDIRRMLATGFDPTGCMYDMEDPPRQCRRHANPIYEFDGIINFCPSHVDYVRSRMQKPDDLRREIELAERAQEEAQWHKQEKVRVSGVYVLLDETRRRVKIGVSGNVERRIRALRTASSEDLKLIHWCPVGNGSAYGLEDRTHRAFAHARRGNSEWFDVGEDPDGFIQAVREYIEREKDQNRE